MMLHRTLVSVRFQHRDLPDISVTPKRTEIQAFNLKDMTTMFTSHWLVESDCRHGVRHIWKVPQGEGAHGVGGIFLALGLWTGGNSCISRTTRVGNFRTSRCSQTNTGPNQGLLTFVTDVCVVTVLAGQVSGAGSCVPTCRRTGAGTCSCESISLSRSGAPFGWVT